MIRSSILFFHLCKLHMNPYDILDVTNEATDDEIRKAYLELVRKFPPDTCPEQFKKIREAYSFIENETARIKYYLFNKNTYGSSPMEIFLDYFRAKCERKPLDFPSMKKYLNSFIAK